MCGCACVCVCVCVCVHFSQGDTAPSSKHTLPAVRTSSQVGVGKGCEVHRADLKWLKSSLQCLFYAFSRGVRKAELELFPRSQGAKTRGGKERDGWRGRREWSSEAQDCNAFQVETRSWTIRGEMADLVNSGPPRTHLRWRLIPLPTSERKCLSLAVISRGSLDFPKFLLDRLTHTKRTNYIPLPVCLAPFRPLLPSLPHFCVQHPLSVFQYLSLLFPPLSHSPDIYAECPLLSSTFRIFRRQS